MNVPYNPSLRLRPRPGPTRRPGNTQVADSPIARALRPIGRVIGLGAAGFCIAALAGCVTSTVQEVREAHTGIGVDDRVVVLGRRHKTSNETETDFIDCVGDQITGKSDGVDVMRESEFVDAVFPWFEPLTAPLDVDDLSNVISRPLVAERIDEIGVRYLIWIEGNTERSSESGRLTCNVISGAIPACIGFLSWDSDSNYEASIWDVRSGVHAGRVSAEASGTSFVPAVVVPIPIIARVRQSACTGLSDQLHAFLASES